MNDLSRTAGPLSGTDDSHAPAEGGAQGVFRVDAQGLVTFADDRAAQMLGYEPAQIKGRHFAEFHFEAELAQVRHNFDQRRLGVGGVTEYPLRRRDGAPLWVAVASVPIFDEGGAFLGITGFISDIDQCRRRQDLAGHERRLLRQITGNAPLTSVLEDLCLTLEAVSRRPLHAAVMLADGANLKCIAAPGLPPGFRTDRAATRLEGSGAACAEAVRSGQKVVIVDTARADAAPEIAALRRDYGFGAVWSYPIVQDEATLGTLALLLLAPGEPDAEDEHVIEFALQVARLALARERDARSLRESEQRFRDFANLSADWFWEQDAEFRFTQVIIGTNSHASVPLHHMGVIGRHRRDLPYINVAEGFWDEHQRLLAAGKSFSGLQLQYRGKDGCIRHALISGRPLFDNEGRLTGYRGTGRDITEQKCAEEVLRASESLLAKVLELLPVGVWFLDATGNILRTNAAGRRIWGGVRYVGMDKAGEYRGWRLDTGKRIEAEEWAGARAIMKGETSIDEEIEIECFDGARKIILNSAMPLRGEDGAISGAVFMNQDITARWHAERQVRELAATLETRVRARTAALEEANHELDAFNFSVSHDLRTPLRAIEGFSQALSEDYHDRLDEAGRDYLQRIGAATTRMGELIEALYNLARLSRAPQRPRPVDLSAMARELLAELREREPGRAVEIEIAETPAAEGDARLLRIVLANLLGNAWKYTARTAPARIAFGARRSEGGRVVYFVRDNGAGFDMQFADKLFRLFHRLHREEEFGGYGVGLATAQRIVRRHGGRIWAEAARAMGATFFFTLWEDAALRSEAVDAAELERQE